MLFSRLSILSGDGCDWWLHVKVVCGRYASFCGNMGFGGGEGGNIAWIFPEQSLNFIRGLARQNFLRTQIHQRKALIFGD